MFNTEHLRCGITAAAGPMLFHAERSRCRMTTVGLRTEYRSAFTMLNSGAVETSVFEREPSHCTIAENVDKISLFSACSELYSTNFTNTASAPFCHDVRTRDFPIGRLRHAFLSSPHLPLCYWSPRSSTPACYWLPALAWACLSLFHTVLNRCIPSHLHATVLYCCIPSRLGRT